MPFGFLEEHHNHSGALSVARNIHLCYPTWSFWKTILVSRVVTIPTTEARIQRKRLFLASPNIIFRAALFPGPFGALLRD